MKKRIMGFVTAICVMLTPIIPFARADTTDTDPVYRVTVTQSGTTYTAAVTLENITATYGTFGLKYDTELFEFAKLTAADGVEIKTTPDEAYGGTWSDANGYKLFVWQAGGYEDEPLDTTASPKKIATLTFKLKQGADADKITLSSFTVMPWDRTREGRKFAEKLTSSKPILNPQTYYTEYWRYCDEVNDTPERGRLAREKAVIHGIDTGGFYQAAVNADLDDEQNNTYFYDVKTEITYKDMDIKNSALIFHVIDKETGEDIEDAEVSVFRGDTILTKDTNYLGEASFPTSLSETVTYTYSVTKEGYLPVPLTGAAKPSVTTKETESKLVTVAMERGYKLIGNVDLSQGLDITEANVQTGATVTFTRADGTMSAVETTKSRKDAYFEVMLPKGEWTLTVTKHGYVKYVITEYTFNPTDTAEETLFADGKKITPYIGSARTGTSVSLLDAAIVKAEMRTGEVNEGDVDDDGYITVTDMAYVKFNYGIRTVNETYENFLSK